MAAVRDVMSADLVAVEPTDLVTTAAAIMDAARVGAALVMDHDVLKGIFTERDVLRALRREPVVALESPVSTWMTPDPMTVGPETRVVDALRKMLKGGFRHLPVLADGHVVGVVSLRDLARSLAG
jgi:phosphoserine phosphatase RsbU/P